MTTTQDSDAAPQPDEPRKEAFNSTLRSQILLYWLALRPQFFIASVMPIIVGTSWGAIQSGRLDLLSALLGGLCMILGHGAGNLFNDLHDDATGNDAINAGRIYPFSGGSRFLQNGVMGRRTMWIYSLTLLLLTAAPGLILLNWHGWGIAIFGAILFVIVVLHHLPPIRLSYHGFAEIDIALAFGFVPVAMASWLQTGALQPLDLLVAVPVAMWVANILLINDISDRVADANAGKKTFTVLFGVMASRMLHVSANTFAFAASAGLAALQILKPWGLIGSCVLFALGVLSAILISPDNRDRMTTAIKITLAVHAFGSLWLAAWIVLS